jgi:hypothetical protein
VKLASLEVDVAPAPLDVPRFGIKQHGHARYPLDPGNRWMRDVVAALFMR